MARYIDGKIKGKIGNMVGVELHGKNYLRHVPNRTAPPTEGELKNRFQMQLLSRWLRPLTPYLRQGFRNHSWNYEGFSAAVSVNHKTALIKNGFESQIDPTLVQVSSGSLSLPGDLQVVLNPEKVLEFFWTPAINNTQGPRDRIMMLAYNPEKEQAFMELYGSIRYQGSASLSLPEALPGSFHIYAAFVAEDGSRQSDSKYLGTADL